LVKRDDELSPMLEGELSDATMMVKGDIKLPSFISSIADSLSFGASKPTKYFWIFIT
jgi:hypothetical protein